VYERREDFGEVAAEWALLAGLQLNPVSAAMG